MWDSYNPVTVPRYESSNYPTEWEDGPLEKMSIR
jgi:hypothetical protein